MTTLPVYFTSKLRKLASLNATEWRLLFKALYWMPCIGTALHIFGYQKVAGYCSRHGTAEGNIESGAKDLDRAKAAARMTSLAARYGPYRAKCLTRALVLIRLLSSENISGKLVLGTRKSSGKITAHAWVEVSGTVLLDGPKVRHRFVPFGWDENVI